MGFDEITTIISTVGFPIAVTLLLMWYINNTQKQLITQMVEISKQLALLIQAAIKERGDGDDVK